MNLILPKPNLFQPYPFKSFPNKLISSKFISVSPKLTHISTKSIPVSHQRPTFCISLFSLLLSTPVAASLRTIHLFLTGATKVEELPIFEVFFLYLPQTTWANRFGEYTFPIMRKLTFLTKTHYRHAETYFQTMTLSHHADTDIPILATSVVNFSKWEKRKGRKKKERKKKIEDNFRTRTKDKDGRMVKLG